MLLSEHLSSEMASGIHSLTPTVESQGTLRSIIRPSAHILLVCKSQALADDTKKFIKGRIRIQIAEDFQKALEYLTEFSPDLILYECDLHLKEFTEILRRQFSQLPPVLVFASLQDRKKNVSLLNQGITDFILKPLEPAEFQTRVSSYLEFFRTKRILERELHHSHEPLDILAQELAHNVRELHRLNRMKDEFLAVLSHELRNPINVIAGFAEILKSEADASDLTREAAEAIYRNAQFQIKLVTDLLDVSRGVAGKLVLDCKPMEMNRLLKELWPSAQEAADKKSQHLVFQEDEHSGWIHADSMRISQVIWNLLSNAIKFTPDGGRIEVRLSRHHQWIEFSVTDTGVGIDPKFLPYMFERFHQQDSSITKTFGGLGLGLAIVRHIVELHAGTVIASSEGPGKGATFTVRLPALPN